MSMFLLHKIAETRIDEAVARGEFDNLPGAGKPLKLDDDRHIPEHLRIAYRILKNAGCVPPELDIQREIHQVEQLLTDLDDDAEKQKVIKKINYLMARLSFFRGKEVDLRLQEKYYEKLCEKLNRNSVSA